ncbi:MAG: glycosyltransferase family 4 protein [Timaviella obliquedivisa GSE-PSE-MK23-08B]|jgi:glycosyltransferase involved in cell wall biosynthesis|nr:glycosyltransferase family 4 protein [Timaviella obliquedivisa GSE-PSE-MK23-08B]
MKIAVIGARGLPPIPQEVASLDHDDVRHGVPFQGAATSGIEHYCAELYPRVVEAGHTVDLFARSSYVNRSWYRHFHDRGVRVIPMPCLNKRGADALISSCFGAISSVLHHYDIVHFHALGPALFSFLPRIASSSKIVVSCHGLDWQRVKWGKFSSRLIRLGEETAVRYAHEIIAVSQPLQGYFWKTYGRQTVYIPNAPATYEASDPAFRFGSALGLRPKRYMIYLGRLVPEKAPDLLIQAFQKLQPPGWTLVFIGKSSDTSSFTSNLLALANKNPNIVFTGELSGGRLAEIVRGAGLYVSASELEGLPLSMLEAMQEGIPMLASDIPPHQQLVGDDRGVMFQTGNLDSFVSQMDWAISNPQDMAERANRAQEFIRLGYQWDAIVTDTIKLYRFLKSEQEYNHSII